MALNRINKNMIDQDFVKKVDDTKTELDTFKNDTTAQLAQSEMRAIGKSESLPLKKGIITFTWDNHYIDHYTTVLPEFKFRNLPFAISPVSDPFASLQMNTGYYNYKQFQELLDYGVELIAHGTTGVSLTQAGTSLAQAEYEIADCKRFFNELGIKVNGYCALSSKLHSDYHEISKQHYDFSYNDNWQSNSIANSVIDENTDLYRLGRRSLYTDYTNGGIEHIKEAIDYAEATGTWLNYYNHRVGSGIGDSIPLTVLQEILDYVQTKNLDVLLPTDAVQRLNTKFIAGENIKSIRQEINKTTQKSNANLLDNPQYGGSSYPPESWLTKTDITSGLTSQLVDYGTHKSIKHAFDSTDNTGKYIRISKIQPLSSIKKSTILTFSIEVVSDSDQADLSFSLVLQNNGTTVNSVQREYQIVKGTNVYEVSMLVPNGEFTELSFNHLVIPKSATTMNIEILKPKLEYSRTRTNWMDYKKVGKDNMGYRAADVVVDIPHSTSYPIKWNVKDYDDLNGYNPTTGEYTVQHSGLFSISATLTMPLDIGIRAIVQIMVNNTVVRATDNRPSTSNQESHSISAVLRLNAGDKVKITLMHNKVDSNVVATLSNPYSFVNINKLD